MSRATVISRAAASSSLLLLFAACAAGITACRGEPGREPGPPGRVSDRRGAEWGPGLVVAEVDGVPIYLEQVAEMMSSLDGGVEPDGIARALVDGELLAREAAARGYGDHPDVAAARSRTMARLLLEREIGGMRPEDIPVERLRAVYEARKAHFDRGPARVVIHALARASKKDPGSARILAEELAAAAAGAANEQEFREALAPVLTRVGRQRLVIEKLPPFTADDTRFAAPFVEAGFAVQGPGRIGGPVETAFGWHVILLLEELPAVRVSFEEAREEIARGIIDEERSRRAAELLGGLERRVRPWIDETAFPGGGER